MLIHLSVKRIIDKPEDTLKLMCIFLGHLYRVFRAFENVPLVHLLWPNPMKIGFKYIILGFTF